MVNGKGVRGTQTNKLSASNNIEPDSIDSVYRDVSNMSISDYLTATCEGQVIELRVLSDRGASSAFGNDYERLEKIALSVSGKVKGVYYTPNPLRQAKVSSLMPSKATADSDVGRRRWLLLDFDPCRKSNTSSTDDELELARIRAEAVRDYLSDKNWPLPVENMSGNGYHLMYRIDLPTEDKRVPAVLRHLSKLFSDDSVDVDTKVGNPARIWKLPGTLTCKGEDTADRPHRMARVVAIPAKMNIVPPEALDALIGSTSAVKVHTADFDLSDFVARHLPEAVAKERSYSSLFYSIPTCPFNPEHNRGEAYLAQFASGAVAAGCHHNSCNWKWGDLWKKFEASNPMPAVKPKGEKKKAGGGMKRTGYTDMGNAERLVERNNPDIRYDVDRATWMIWGGARWVPDNFGGMSVKAKAVALSYYSEITDSMSEQAQERLFNHATRSESAGRLAAMIDVARSDERVVITSDKFDSNIYHLNCTNGTLDLTSGELKPHCREDYHSRIAIAYNPNASCPKWASFLAEVFSGDEDTIRYLQKWAGYSLSGDTSEDKLIILHGKGRNGKGCIVAGLMSALGREYSAPTPFTTFISGTHTDSARADLAGLKGKRMIIASEGEGNTTFAEALVKQLTGGDVITCRELYKPFFSYKPQFKIWLATNHIPKITTQSVAIKSRIRIIPLLRQFGGEGATDKCDKGVRDSLERGDEAEGILAWAVRGFTMWQAEGLGNEPQAVINATREVFLDHDKLGAWLEAECVFERGAECLQARLWDNYCAWCEGQGVKPAFRSSGKFAADLLSRGGVGRVKTNRGWVITGVGLSIDHDADELDRALAAEELAQGQIHILSHNLPLK